MFRPLSKSIFDNLNRRLEVAMTCAGVWITACMQAILKIWWTDYEFTKCADLWATSDARQLFSTLTLQLHIIIIAIIYYMNKMQSSSTWQWYQLLFADCRCWTDLTSCHTGANRPRTRRNHFSDASSFTASLIRFCSRPKTSIINCFQRQGRISWKGRH